MKAQDGEEPAYFLSDVHLGAYPKVEKASIPMLFELLDRITETGGCLYIVGDLLDFWFEYRSVIPRYPFKLLAKLRAMSEKGCRISYVAGNHDYWMGEFLTKDVGVETYLESVETTIGGKRFYISHGDGIATTAGLGYRVLKGILHSRVVSSAFRLVHPDVGLFFANQFSKLSRKRSSRLNSDNDEALATFVRQKARMGFDYVVLGHLHKPHFFRVENTRCLVIGDWIDNFTYGVFKEGNLKLERWKP